MQPKNLKLKNSMTISGYIHKHEETHFYLAKGKPLVIKAGQSITPALLKKHFVQVSRKEYENASNN